MAATLTVLVSAYGRHCGKIFGPNGVEQSEVELLWRPRTETVTTLVELHEVLTTLATLRTAIVVRGVLGRELTPDEVQHGIYRRLIGSGFANGVLVAAPQAWAALDIDQLEAPPGLKPADEIAYLMERVPNPFAGAACVWQRTASWGRKPGLRYRLWYLLSEPVHDAQLKAWAEQVRDVFPVDPSVFSAVQPHYVADPIIRDGWTCPAPRWGIYEGQRGEVAADEFPPVPDATAPEALAPYIVEPNPAEIARRLERIRAQTPRGPRHNWAIGVAAELISVGMPPELIEHELQALLAKHGRAETPGECARIVQFARRKLEAGTLTVSRPPLAVVLDESSQEAEPAPQPTASSEEVVDRTPSFGPHDLLNAQLYLSLTYGDRPGLIRWAEQDWEWTGTHWRRLENDEVLVQRIQRATKMRHSRARATANSVRSIVGRERLQPPCTMDGTPLPRLLVFRNGVLDLDEWLLDPEHASLMPHDPNRFVTAALPYDYDPTATCPTMEAFVMSIWPDDPHQRREYQKFLGYLLLPENPLHKLFVFIGVPRSGKGTTLRLIQKLVGPENCCSPSLSSLAGPFGLDPLIGKTVALIGEANTQGRVSDEVADRLNGISGGDSQAINRKNKTEVHLTLTTRIVLACNRLPSFLDQAGALLTRMVLFSTWISFTGKEDRYLDDKLAAELPGIAQFALRGLRMLLVEDGDFRMAQRNLELLKNYRCAQAPISAFIDEALVPDPNGRFSPNDLYAAYLIWVEESGHRPASMPRVLLEVMHRYPDAWERSRMIRPRQHGSGERPRLRTGFTLTEFARNLLESKGLLKKEEALDSTEEGV